MRGQRSYNSQALHRPISETSNLLQMRTSSSAISSAIVQQIIHLARHITRPRILSTTERSNIADHKEGCTRSPRL